MPEDNMNKPGNVVDFASAFAKKHLTPEAVNASNTEQLRSAMAAADALHEPIPVSVPVTLLMQYARTLSGILHMYSDMEYMMGGHDKHTPSLPEEYARGAAAGANAASAVIMEAMRGATEKIEAALCSAGAPEGPEKDAARLLIAAFARGMIAGEEDFKAQSK